MGRKSIDKQRKPIGEKPKQWVRALTPLLQDKELDRLTLNELADLMGKSKSTIYSYFSTKEEIYCLATQLVLEDIAVAVSEDAISGEDMELALRTLLHHIGEGIEGISIGFLEQIKNHFPEVWQLIDEFTGVVLTNLAEIYTRGMGQGSFKKFNVSLLTALDSHFVMSIMTDASHFSEQGLSLKDLVQEYLELRLSALKKG